MLPRVLEPEVMDTAQEAADYDAMDHSAVNRLFVDDLLAAWERLSPSAGAVLRPADAASATGGEPVSVLDVGTGTAQIPVELAARGFRGAILGIDLAEAMLNVGRRNVAMAGLQNIRLLRVDAKALPFAEGQFDVVMSNSIIHHIPEPAGTFAEMRRVLRPGGLLFVRDLLRPPTQADVERIVATYAGGETPRQQQLFRQSLHAALSLDELRAVLAAAGIGPGGSQTSDRHWTLELRVERLRVES